MRRAAVAIICGVLGACRCGSQLEPPRDTPDVAAPVPSVNVRADAGSMQDAHARVQEPEEDRIAPGTPLTPTITVEEDEDSKEPQIQAHGLPALSVDGKLLALYFTNHAVAVTSEQSLVIIDVAKRAETSKLLLVRQGEISELDEDNPTKHTPAIRARVLAASQLLAKNHWKAPIFKDGSELDLGDDEKQPPIELGPLKLRVDEATHALFVEREGSVLHKKDIKGWSNMGKPVSLSDLVFVPAGESAGLLVLTSSEFDGDPNPRRALRLVPFGAAGDAGR